MLLRLNREQRRALRYRGSATEDCLLRISPYNLPRPRKKQERREFIERYEEGQVSEPLVVVLKTPGLADQLRAADEAERMWVLFGVGEDPDLGPAPMPEEGVVPSRPLFGLACVLWICQVTTEEGDTPYTPLEWVTILTRMPKSARKLSAWVQELMGIGEAQSKNSPGAGTAASSGPRSNSPESTPRSPTDGIFFSAQSTPDLATSALDQAIWEQERAKSLDPR